MSIKQRSTKSGFTLIELLVAMTIVAVLSGLILSSFIGARKASRDAKRKADLEQIRSALEMYRADKNEYPNIANLNSGIVDGAKVYLAAPKDPDTNQFYYYSRTATNTYSLCTALELPDTNSSYCTSTCGTAECKLTGADKTCNCKKQQP